MFKSISFITIIVMSLAGSAQAASVFHYDGLKIKAILDSPKVGEMFKGNKLSNGGAAVSIQAIEMGTIDQKNSKIYFTLKSSGCSLPVTLSFDPSGWNPNYQVSEVANWVCP